MRDPSLGRSCAAALLVGVLQVAPVWLAAAGAAEALGRPAWGPQDAAGASWGGHPHATEVAWGCPWGAPPGPLLPAAVFALAWAVAVGARLAAADAGPGRQAIGALGVAVALGATTVGLGLPLPAGLALLPGAFGRSLLAWALFAGSLYLWWHGLRAGALRPDRDEAVAASASSGVVTFLVLLALTGTRTAAESGPPVLLGQFFAGGGLLLLSQIERLGTAGLGPRGWTAVLAGAALVVALSALLLAAALGGPAGELLLLLLRPFLVVLGLLLLTLFLLAALLAEALAGLLRALLAGQTLQLAATFSDLAAQLQQLAHQQSGALPADLLQFAAWLVVGLLLLGAALLLAGALQRRRRRAEPADEARESLLSSALTAASLRRALGDALGPLRRLRRQPPEAGADWRSVVRRAYREALLALARSGWEWRPEATPQELLAALEAHAPALAPELRRLTAAYQFARYAGPTVPDLDPTPAVAASRQVRAALRSRRWPLTGGRG